MLPDGEIGFATRTETLIWAGSNLTKNDDGDIVFCENATDFGYYFVWPDAMVACPTGWRLPTRDELADLIGYTGTDIGAGVANGIYTTTSLSIDTYLKGMKVATKAINGVAAGQELYFPAAGNRSYGEGTGSVPTTNIGSYARGRYWTSGQYEDYPDDACDFEFSTSRSTGLVSKSGKEMPLPVRCVRTP